MLQINYIECAGVRVPADWTAEQLRQALAKRSIRFQSLHEQEIMNVFGEAILLKKTLEENIDKLNREINRLEGLVKDRSRLLACPSCGTLWTQPVPEQPPKAEAVKKVSKSPKVEVA